MIFIFYFLKLSTLRADLQSSGCGWGGGEVGGGGGGGGGSRQYSIVRVDLYCDRKRQIRQIINHTNKQFIRWNTEKEKKKKKNKSKLKQQQKTKHVRTPTSLRCL